jgi:hypothetical protein
MKKVALVTTILNTPLFLAGIIYLNSLEPRWVSTDVVFFMLCLLMPLWIHSQREQKKSICSYRDREHGIFEPEPVEE